MTLYDVFDRYVAELEADGIPDPLAETFTLSAVMADLFRLAGEPLPLDVAAYLTKPAAPEPLPAA
jgi:hypothetical protein